MPHNSGEMMQATIKSRLKSYDGDLIGRKSDNPMHDTRKYNIEFVDGSHAEYQANILAENLYSQIDHEGRQYSQIDGISDHKCDDNAIPKENGWVTMNSGSRKRRITTKGWWLLMTYKDGTSSWTSLKEAKEANPI